MSASRWLGRLGLLALILAAEFVVLEAGLRWHGGSEASPGFQKLFMQDPRVGHRLSPGAWTRYTTPEFSTHIAINPQGVRDDQPIGPKAPDETRIVMLGDSLVLSVQVELQETFAKQLERGLQAQDPSRTWRVINAGVQGYGPVDEWLFYKHVVDAFDPDLVLVMAFVGNDAVEAHDKAAWIDAGARLDGDATQQAATRVRRIVRSSMVLQGARLRWDQLTARFEGPGTERPLTSYLADPPADVIDGLEVTRRAYSLIATTAAARGAQTALILMPARFQTDDADYGRLKAIVAEAGGELVRHAATERFTAALKPLGLPMLDLLPVLQAEPNRVELFFQRNVHLTPRGHQVVGKALTAFVAGLESGRD
jgi:lysophospholipase L1-like esterase